MSDEELKLSVADAQMEQGIEEMKSFIIGMLREAGPSAVQEMQQAMLDAGHPLWADDEMRQVLAMFAAIGWGVCMGRVIGRTV